MLETYSQFGLHGKISRLQLFIKAWQRRSLKTLNRDQNCLPPFGTVPSLLDFGWRDTTSRDVIFGPVNGSSWFGVHTTLHWHFFPPVWPIHLPALCSPGGHRQNRCYLSSPALGRMWGCGFVTPSGCKWQTIHVFIFTLNKEDIQLCS